MASSKTLSSLVLHATLAVAFLQLNLFSSAAAVVKGGYWYYDSGLAASDIDSTRFTHLFCAFADLNSTTSQITLPSSVFFTFSKTVRSKNPSVKALLSIGGGGGPTLASKFSSMAGSSTTRKSFIDSTIRVARANNFDGLDLDWEYPSTDADKTNLGLLLSEWRSAVAQESRTSGKPPLLITSAVAGSDQISPLNKYPGQSIATNLDWANVMVYDLFIPDGYPKTTQPPAPLFNPRGTFSGDQGIRAWINQVGVPANKLAIGLPFYGYAWKLVNGNNHGLFDAANGAASTPSGGGVMDFSEVRKFIANQRATRVYNSTFVTNYCYAGTTWVGYDDTETVTAKVNYAKVNLGLIGYFIWQIGGDDANWTLSKTASTAWGS